MARPPLEKLLYVIEDRCNHAALVLETLAETMLDRDGDASCVEMTAAEAVARELRVLSKAALETRGTPEQIPAAVARLEERLSGHRD